MDKTDDHSIYRRGDSPGMKEPQKKTPSTPPPAAEAADEDRSSLKLLVKGLVEHTGVQGVPNISRARSSFRKIVWATMVMLGVAMLVYMMTLAALKYTSYPVDTKIDVMVRPMLSFPAVTICNLNPIRMSALNLAGDTMTGVYGKKKDPQTGLSEPKTFFEWDAENSNTETSDFSAREECMTLLSGLTREKRQAIGHRIDWMLLHCSFQGKTCTPANFSQFQNYMYGNCYTFNANAQESALLVNEVGPLYGLTLELYVQQAEYLAGISDSAGFRIIIHNQTTMPFPEDSGFSVQPGTKASVGMKRIETTRAPAPYGSCRVFSDQETRTRSAFVEELPSINYTTAACKKTCYQQNLVAECDCFDPKFPFCHNCTAFANNTNGDATKPCTSPDHRTQKAACVEKVASDYMTDRLGCSEQCPTECFYVSYAHSISASSWPAANTQHAMLEKLLSRSEGMWTMMQNWSMEAKRTFMKENLLKLELYYEDLNYQTIETRSSYGALELLSEFGGQAGLWLGVSIIAVFEVIELVIDLVGLLFHKAKPKAKQGSKVGIIT